MTGENMPLLSWHGEPTVMNRLALKQDSRPTGSGVCMFGRVILR